MDRACRSASVAAMAWLVIACWDFASLRDGDAPGQPAPQDASGDVIVTGEGGPSADAGAPLDGAPASESGADGPDAGAPWKIYSRSIAAPNQWNMQPLDQVWTGANAPPARDIRATVQLSVSDHLMVVTSDAVYVRAGAAWRTPVPLTVAMPVLVGKSFSGARHLVAKADAAVPTEYITFSDNPSAYIYETDGTSFTYFDTRALSDSPPPISAPQGTKQSRWAVVMTDPSQLGTANYLNEYEAYENDGNVYFFDATPAFTNKWVFADCPLFAGTIGAPPETDIMSGWHDDATDVTYLIVR